MASGLASSNRATNVDCSFGRLIWLGTLIANLIIFSMAAVVISDIRKTAETEAQLLTENYARILEENLAGFVNKIDISLISVTDELGRQESNGGIKTREIEAFLARRNEQIPETLGLRISDAKGTVIYAGPEVQVRNASVSDRPFFTSLRDDPGAGLYIAKPSTGPVSLKMTVAMARRINSADGSFAGVVYIAVPVDYFVTKFSRINLGTQGNSGLWDKTSLIARFSKADPYGAKTGATTPSPQLQALLNADTADAYYQAKSGIDGISRIYHFRRVSTYPLFLVVGLADEDYLAEWRDNSLKIGGLVVLFLIATLVFARLAYINWQRRELARAQLQEANLALKARTEEAETARQRSELILASAGEGICGIDTKGRVTFINQAARKMFGWGENEGIGEDLHALTHHHHADSRAFPAHECPAFATLHDGQQRQIDEDCYWRKDGTSFLVEYTTSALEQDGKISGVVNVFRDITQRKRSESELDDYRRNLEALVRERTSALLETEARASHILESSASGLYGIDRNGNITFINPAACAMLGHQAEHVIGQGAHKLLHHSKADGTPYPAADCPSYQALRRGQQVRVDNEVYWHADGHAIAVIYATHPMKKDGEIYGAVTSFIDVSEQRAAAEARERALIAAENLAKVRSEFLANMSHEIRTPLNGVLGFADIGHRHYQNSEKARDAFNKIRLSGKRLLGIINDILDFSKIEAGKLSIEQTEVSVVEVINQAVDILADRIHSKGLALHVELSPELPESCISDPLRMGQVLLNVMSNAVKFTETGSITLAASRQNDSLVFRITDTGIGMTEKQRFELFSAFHQADASASRRFGGTGLGLAISKRILELMGGEIRAESQLGVGSMFEFRLPFVPPNEPAPQLSPDDSVTASPISKPLAGISVLAAEDEPVNQAILEENLLEDGARVTMVSNGQEALLRIVENGRDAYDIVLMDLQMPEMDGYEATRCILELAPDLPIIAQTAHAFGEERERCFAAGMVGHIAKPIDPDELVSIIRKHARSRHDR